ncbi:MAG: MMPL family transporter [Microthrixaceae bacterium]
MHRHERAERHDRSQQAPQDLSGLGRLGRGIARHHRWVAVVWVVVLLGAGWVGGVDKKEVSDNFSIPNTDSQSAYDLLSERFSSQNGASATVVFAVPDGQRIDEGRPATAVQDAVKAIRRLPGVTAVSDPIDPSAAAAIAQVASHLDADQVRELDQLVASIPHPVSDDHRIALANVSYDRSVVDLLDRYPVDADEAASAYTNPWSQLERALAEARDAGVSAAVGGAVADTWNNPVSWWANHADEVGLLIGALLLLVAFGSLWGMAIPISTALFGAVTASGLVYLLASVTTVSSAAPPVALMISLGVGLDYSLLIVTRYRQFIADGHDPEDAVGYAVQTSGRAAIFAGITVCIALLGLLLVPIPLVRTLGLAAAIGVAVMVVAATTLLPALLGFAGRRIDALGLPNRRDRHVDPATSFWGRFATAVSGKAWLSLIGGGLVLLVLALPFLHIRFGMPDDGSMPTTLSQRQAYDRMEEGFGPGINAPLVVAVGLDASSPTSYQDALEQLRPVSDALGAEQPAGTVRGVESTVGPIPNSLDRTTAVIYQVTPTTGPDADATTALVERLRSDLARTTEGTSMRAHVGGATATLIDLTHRVETYLPIVIGAVVLGAFVLLMLVFRSVLVPLKAAAMNLLSIGAAYGVVVAVFQWGWARQLVGISETIPIVSFVPLVMFVILFGLSMDYEVFLMSRMKEEWDRTGDARTSIVLGVANTARVITTAALIMMVVFMSFVTNPSPTVKLIGFGMAVAVLIDSTLVRMVLVPAIMELLGPRAWAFPRWLRWLPHLDVDGNAPEPVAAAPAADDSDATEPELVGSN